MKTLQWLVLAVLAISLCGCQMFRQVPPGHATSPIAGAEGEWECTGSKENGDWDCQRISESGEADSSFATTEQTDSDPVAHAIYSADPPQSAPVTVHRYDPSGDATVQQVATQPKGEEPEYLWLSYRPDVPTRIEDLPDNYYAVQLAAFSDMKKANNYASNNTWLVEPRGVRIASGSKKYYVILLGIYESRTRAERAANSIAQHVGSDKPWVRSMTSLKPAIKAAEEKFGNERL